MKPLIVTDGEIFERLEALSAGKLVNVLLPVERRPSYDEIMNPPDPVRDLLQTEEWEPVWLLDGRRGWRRKSP